MSKFPIISLLAGSLFTGLAFAVLLPPFEGFDETAHYSYIQQIAEAGTWPRFNDPISAEVEDYLRVAPGAASLHSPWSYRTFFDAPADVISAGRAAARAPRDRLRPWRVTEAPSNNWEGQHPPLYYLVLAPAFSLSNGLSLQRQLSLLRGLSYLMAWIGLCIAACSLAVKNAKDVTARAAAALGLALWPALFPMWFIDMARLGNDSLVAFWIACVALVVQRLMNSNGNPGNYLILGLVCGLGLLTKATFLPVAAATGSFLLYQTWRARKDEADFRRCVRGLVVFGIAIIVVAGWWYGKNIYDTGTLIGAEDEVRLQEKGSMLSLFLHNLKNVSPGDLIHGTGVMGLSFLWIGTWSLVSPPLVSALPLALFAFVVIAGYLRVISKGGFKNSDLIPLLTLLFFWIAIIQQTLIFVAAGSKISVGTWYLHSYAPILAPLAGQGLAEVSQWRRARPVFRLLSIYPLFFLPFATGVLAVYFSGCGDRYPGGTYDFSSAKFCVSDVSGMLHNLAVLGDPKLAIGLFVVGWTLMLPGLIAAVNTLGPERERG